MMTTPRDTFARQRKVAEDAWDAKIKLAYRKPDDPEYRSYPEAVKLALAAYDALKPTATAENQ